MKILWLCSWYPNPRHPYDGDFIQRHARAVAKFIPITVFFVSQEGGGVEIPDDQVKEFSNERVDENIIIPRFKKTGLHGWDMFRFNLHYYRRYKKIIRDFINKQGKPDLVHVHIPMKAGILGKWIHSKWGIPYVLSEQSSQYNTVAPRNFFSRSIFHRRQVRSVFRTATVVTNVSATVGNTLQKIFGLAKVRTIHNTVNTSLFYYKPRVPGKFRFIHVSTLTEQKNPESILRATANLAKQRDDFELLIVGPANNELKELAARLSLGNRVRFTGEIPYAEVALQMQQSSALVLFSRHENFPCVIIEALCSGLPCIAANVGGVAEAVNDSNGLLVSPGNEEELSAAMNKMLKEYSHFNREAIAREAQDRYSYPVIGKQFYDLYKEITQKD
jgi:glycosyltransferase involved in cell wall biosynthesis